MIALQPFVSLSFLKRGGVSLIGKHSPHSLCFVMPEDGQIILTSLFCSYVNIFRMTGALWNCKNCTPPLTILCVFPQPIPNIFLHLQRQMKPNEVCSVLGAKLISNVDGTHTDHVNHDCPKQSNHGRRNSD